MSSVATSSLPDIFTSWDDFSSLLRGRRLCLFLDYDGTLTPIVADPAQARLPPAVAALLRELSERIPVAIVSGRSCAALSHFVSLPAAYLATSHGAEIRPPATEAPAVAVAPELVAAVERCYANLSAKLSKIPGCLVEKAPYSVPVHYRNVSMPSCLASISAAVAAEAISAYFRGRLRVTRGKRVLDIRPCTGADKGSAVLRVLAEIERTHAGSSSSSGGSCDRGSGRGSNGRGLTSAADGLTSSHAAERAVDTQLKSAQWARRNHSRALGDSDTVDGDDGTDPSRSLSESRRGVSKTHLTTVTAASAAAAASSGAAAAAAASAPAGGGGPWFAVYVGDDTTDEDAFRALADAGAGVGVRVRASGGRVRAPADSASVARTERARREKGGLTFVAEDAKADEDDGSSRGDERSHGTRTADNGTNAVARDADPYRLLAFSLSSSSDDADAADDDDDDDDDDADNDGSSGGGRGPHARTRRISLSVGDSASAPGTGGSSGMGAAMQPGSGQQPGRLQSRTHARFSVADTVAVEMLLRRLLTLVKEGATSGVAAGKMANAGARVHTHGGNAAVSGGGDTTRSGTAENSGGRAGRGGSSEADTSAAAAVGGWDGCA